MIDTEILHFGRLGAEKIEFEVGGQISKTLKNVKFSLIFYLEDILILKHSLQSK